MTALNRPLAQRGGGGGGGGAAGRGVGRDIEDYVVSDDAEEVDEAEEVDDEERDELDRQVRAPSPFRASTWARGLGCLRRTRRHQPATALAAT